ncbi:MAG: STAS domain-containing protein [Pseudomonadota bacterium]
MDTQHFEVNVSEIAGEVVIELVGWMDVMTSAKFRAVMMKQIQGMTGDVVLDCGRLDYIDSSSMGILLLWREKLQPSQRAIIIANSRGPVLDAFKLVGFPRLFKFR